MAIISGKVRKGKMSRLTIMGNVHELSLACGITQERITSNQLTFPPDYVIVGELKKVIPTIVLAPDVDRWYQDELDRDTEIGLAIQEWSDVKLAIELRDYQRNAISFISKARRVIIGDACGLGKTLEAYGAVAEVEKVLIIVPSYGIQQWVEEYDKVKRHHQLFAIEGTKQQKEDIMKQAFQTNGPVIVIIGGPSLIRPQHYPLIQQRWDAVIVDEAHRISNRKNLLTQVIQTVSKNTDMLIFLTGSALTTRFPDVLWSMLNCIDPLRFSSYWSFYHRFIESYVDFYGRVPLHSKNMDVLGEVLAPIYLRRTKEEVASELPPKIQSVVKVQLKPEHRRIYDRILKERLVGGLELLQGIQLFGYLQRLVNYPEGLGYEHYDCKTEVVMEMVKDILQNGEKVVIFGWHKDYLKALHTGMQKITIDAASEGSKLTHYQSVYVDGDLSPSLRNMVLDKFRTDAAVGVLIGTIKSIGELVNLAEASNVIFVEGFWNPEVMKQAADRCHRITSKYPVNVYWIVADNTIDTQIYEVCEAKEGFINEAHAVLQMIQKMKGVDKNGM